MTNDEVCFLPLTEISDLIRTGQISPVEVTDAVLNRIERIAPTLNCYLTILPDKARQRAHAMENLIQSGKYLGPLHGIPISLKDNIATAGIRTTAGSLILANWVPETNATVFNRLQAAGAVLVAKAHLYEFCDGFYHPLYGPTHNPWNIGRSCGGSSNGSASAVAAGLCFASIGTDTGGSIRIPAGFCGIVGLKPTYGRVSRAGVIPYSDTLDHVGPITRNVRDAGVVLQTIAGYDTADLTTLKQPVPNYAAGLEEGLKGLRLATAQLEASDLMDPEVRAAIHQAYAVFEREGAVLTEVRLPDLTLARITMETISNVEAAEYHRSYLRTRAIDYHPGVRSQLETAEFIPATEYVHAQRVRKRMTENFRPVLASSDALALPTLPIPAYPTGQRKIEVNGQTAEAPALRIHYNSLFNLTGHPAIVLPCGFTSTGLPIGLQLVSRPFDEETLLRVAWAYEQATQWHLRRPPVYTFSG